MARYDLLLALVVTLFTMGLLGVMVRRNLLVVVMSLELMLNAVVLSFVAAAVFAMFLGSEMSVGTATAYGFSAGLCWVAASYGITYLFEHRPLTLWLVNAGYHTLQFTLFGLIIGYLQ
jgi:hypothetical protein